METLSNIQEYYEELVDGMAERALDDIKNGVEENEAINQALDDGLMYYADQAYVIAHELINGVIEWGKDIEWDAICEDIYTDIYNEIDRLKEEENERA